MRARRGFTLIELMVAMTAGLFFSVVVFMMMRDVSRFFQRETRVADATMSAVIGFERLKADLTRAGYLASPLLLKDPHRCPRPPAALNTGGWAAYPPLAQMGALYIDQGLGGASLSAAGQALLTANSLSPDRIRLYGNYQTAEQFPVDVISPAGGATVTIQLKPDSGALRRIGYNPATPVQTVLDAAFPVGRALRVVSREGDEQYSIIQSVIPDVATGSPIITLDQAGLSLRYKETEATCGITGVAAGFWVNTVNIIEYSLNDALVQSNANYQDLRIGTANEPWARTDLVRTELDPKTGAAVANPPPELIAEYAVDLRFGITVLNLATNVMTTFNAGDAAMKPFVEFASAATPNRGPHLVRGVRAQMTVRSRAADRTANVPAGLLPAGGLYRVRLSPGGNEYARARTLAATIATRNTKGVRWP